MHVWRKPAQAYDRYCPLPTVKHGGGSVMIWAAVLWFSVGPIVTLKGRITEEKYREILVDQVHPVMQTLFPAGDGIFHDEIMHLSLQRVMSSNGLMNTRMMLNMHFGPLSPDLEIIEPLWSILVFNTELISSTDISPRIFKEWYSIHLNTIQHLYESILMQIQAVLHAKGCPTLYQ
ncbi:DDE_3 domain-containing protein [Trichonephila clavipes]|nr:DDE_3 domain-containing protein [Trichonephila clavipes]